MFKRFKKTLAGTAEDSDESSSLGSSGELDDQISDISDELMSGSGKEDEELESSEAASQSGEEQEQEGSEQGEEAPVVPLGVVTEEELEHVDEEEEGVNYHCTLCPHKVLSSLAEVKAHLQGKV